MVTDQNKLNILVSLYTVLMTFQKKKIRTNFNKLLIIGIITDDGWKKKFWKKCCFFYFWRGFNSITIQLIAYIITVWRKKNKKNAKNNNTYIIIVIGPLILFLCQFHFYDVRRGEKLQSKLFIKHSAVNKKTEKKNRKFIYMNNSICYLQSEQFSNITHKVINTVIQTSHTSQPT